MRRSTRIGIFGMFIVLLAAVESGADSTLRITDKDLARNEIIWIEEWLYSGGDNPVWSSPDFDDNGWQRTRPPYGDMKPPVDGWTGIGWFRITLDVEEELWGRPLGLVIQNVGWLDIYVNGKAVDTEHVGPRGKRVKPTHLHTAMITRTVVLANQRFQVIAIRLESFQSSYDFGTPELAAFRIAIGEPRTATYFVTMAHRRETAVRTFFGAASLTIAFLHFMMFVFFRRYPASLYYALFTLGTAAIAFLPLSVYFEFDAGSLPPKMRLMTVAILFVSLAGQRFVHVLFRSTSVTASKRMVWVWLGGAVVAFALSWNGPPTAAYAYSLILIADILRTLGLAVYHRQRYAIMVSAGSATFVLLSAYQMIANIAGNLHASDHIYLYGLLTMLILMSVALARGFASLGTNLEDRVDEVKTLSSQSLELERRAAEQELERVQLRAENEVKAKELEEIRKRQKVMDELAAANEELRTTQAQLAQSEKMASLGNLVAGVAHEINTPIGAIKSMHDTLLKAVERIKKILKATSPSLFESNGDLQKTFKVIDDANEVIGSGSGRVTKIIKRLRSFARLDEAELKSVDIHEGLDDTLALIRHELKDDIKVEREYGTIPPLTCFPGQLNQVFLNLLVNARQAMPDGGTITIKTTAEGDKISIMISDTGIGIPEATIGKIFDPGFTTKGVGVGTGLGLSICYQIIQSHNGALNVASALGKGSTFTVILPTDLEQQLETMKRKNSIHQEDLP